MAKSEFISACLMCSVYFCFISVDGEYNFATLVHALIIILGEIFDPKSFCSFGFYFSRESLRSSMPLICNFWHIAAYSSVD